MVCRRQMLLASFALIAMGTNLPALASANNKNTVRIGLSLAPTSLDPTSTASMVVAEVFHYNVMEGLVQLDEHGVVRPGLAKKWDISDDGKKYVFHLRPDVFFHNGKPLTASVVKYSLERAIALKEQNKLYAALFNRIEKVSVIDDGTVSIHFTHPDPLTLSRLAESPAVIVHPEAADQLAKHPIGTGPFQFVDYQNQEKITLEKATDFREADSVQIDLIEYHFIPSPEEQVKAIKSSKVDLLFHMTALNTKEFERNNQYEVLRGNSTSKILLAINNKKEPLNHLKVRQALSHAIDREALLRAAFLSYGRAIGSHYAVSEPGYIDLTNVYPFDIERAKHLLAEANVELPLTLNLSLPPTPYALAGGPIIVSALKEIGVNINLLTPSWEEWLSTVFKGDFDLSLILHAEPADYHIYTDPNYYFGYDSPEYNQLVEQYSQNNNPRVQRQIIQKIQRKLADDAVNVWLFTPEIATVVRHGLKGVWMHYPTFAHPVQQMYWQ